MKNPFTFPYTRKPNFKNLSSMDYEQYWKERGFQINQKLKERETIILKEIPSDSSVLMIGCGNSALPYELQKKNCRVTVSDISTLVLKEHQNLGISTLTLDLNQTDSLSLPQKYDWIVLSEVLEHTPQPEQIIKHLSKYTAAFALSIPNSAYIWFRTHLMFSGRFFTQWVYHPSEHLRFWSHKDFIDWLQALQLKDIKAHSSNGFPVLKDIFINLFGFQVVYLAKT